MYRPASLQLFIRCFELDERLLGLAFLDVSIYITSIRTLKNLLLIGDVEKSVWFAAFQVGPCLPSPLSLLLFSRFFFGLLAGGTLQARPSREGLPASPCHVRQLPRQSREGRVRDGGSGGRFEDAGV